MRVLIGPLAELRLGGLASAVAGHLAGPEGTVVSLRKAGVGTLSRRLSEAEVVWLREAVLGGPPECRPTAATDGENLAGYVCAGSLVGVLTTRRSSGAAVVVAATDHADLTWRSPLTGPNDDLAGPRFPSMTGVYAPEVVTGRLGERDFALGGNILSESIPSEGMIVVPGIVAGVLDDGGLSDHEAEMVGIVGCAAVSPELAPMVIVMAHLGLRVAAAVVTRFEGREMPGGGS